MRLYLGDLRSVLADFDAESFEACVTDPPYELGFMGHSWDKSGIAFDPETWRAVYRVLKPGAYLVAFGGTRTYHRIACAIEDAGFEIRDCVGVAAWMFGSGFPKNLRADLAIDKHLGRESEREVVGSKLGKAGYSLAPSKGAGVYEAGFGGTGDPEREAQVDAPATPEAAQWQGWGTALKPAFEPIIIARKKMVGTLAENLLAHGTGAMNIDGCRIGQRDQTIVRGGNQERGVYGKFAHDDKIQEFHYTDGRWPANVVLVHAPECKPRRRRKVKNSSGDVSGTEPSRAGTIGGEQVFGHQRLPRKAKGEDGLESVVEWDCQEGCPVALLAAQSGKSGGSQPIQRKAGERRLATTYSGGKDYTQDYTSPGYSDEGDASRFFAQFHPFFYEPKASRAERDAGCEKLAAQSGGELTGRKDGSAGLNNPRAGAGRTSGGRNTHHTVKPVELMRYLVRLVTPPGGTVLDPFMGSGTTGVAAVREEKDFVGIELMPDHLAIAEARIAHAEGPEPHELPLFAELSPEPEQVSIFDAIHDATRGAPR